MRNNKGQFLKTTDSTIYQNCQYKNKRMPRHVKNFCITLGIDKMPDGLVVHHLDGNTKNNNIDNLAVVTITAHNRIHSHKPWNAGLKAGTNKKWDDALIKAQEKRFETYLPKFKEAFELQLKNKTLKEIAFIQGTSRRQASERIKRYKEYINTNN